MFSDAGRKEGYRGHRERVAALGFPAEEEVEIAWEEYPASGLGVAVEVLVAVRAQADEVVWVCEGVETEEACAVPYLKLSR